MSQADIVPIGTRGKPGRGAAAKRTPSSASRSLAGGKPAAKATPKPADTEPAETEPADTVQAETPPAETAPAELEQPVLSAVPRDSTPPTQPETKAAAEPATKPATKPATGRATKPATKPAATKAAKPPARKRAAEPEPAPEASIGFDLPSSLAELLALAGDTAHSIWGPDADRAIVEGLAFLRRRFTGDYEVDEFGLDPDLTESVLLPLLRPLYERWFRVEVKGAEHLPAEGGALVVANHSGTIAVDAVMTAFAVHDETPSNRVLRMLGADFVFSMPFVGETSRKSGSTLACNEDAHRLLSAGELVGVWPEGVKGIGKPYRERYRLQRFGRGGFVTSAITAGAPIIPTSIVGAEEIYPIIGDIPVLARMIGAPYFPVTPFFPWLGPFGMIPLPSKWIIEFGEPIATDQLSPEEAEDPMAVFDLGDQVRETIQQSLYRLLDERRSVFF